MAWQAKYFVGNATGRQPTIDPFKPFNKPFESFEPSEPSEQHLGYMKSEIIYFTFYGVEEESEKD